MAEIPLGRREDGRLELKGREALKDPSSIGREVVGMLNAEGGEVWVGLQEMNGMAVALEPLDDPQTARRSLLDYLLDSIEPALADELSIEVLQVDSAEPSARAERGVLRIQLVPKAASWPYSLRKRGGWYFWRRVEDRLRPMTREEILRSDRPPRGSPGEERLLASDLEAAIETDGGILWLGAEPIAAIEVDLERVAAEGWLVDPKRTGNRLTGHTFAASIRTSGEPPGFDGDRLVARGRGNSVLSLSPRGGLRFEAPLGMFLSRPAESPVELVSLKLAEMVTSLFRLLGKEYEGAPVPVGSAAEAALALVGLKGVKLWPESSYDRRIGVRELPSHLPDDPHNPKAYPDDLLVAGPLRFSCSEIAADPDRCAYRLMRVIYERYGWEPRDLDRALPGEFDRKTGRLLLSD